MSQFLEVIEWMDVGNDDIVHRVPAAGSAEIKFGAQLIVRENQAAIFFRDGKGLDVLGAGRHTLASWNLPILTKVLSLPWGFTSPFRCEVYFVNQKLFSSLRWGTKDPVVFRDRELGLIRLRAFGAYTMQVQQPLLFLNTLVGTRSAFDTSEVEDYLREIIVSRLNDYLGESVDSLIDLPKHYDEMAVAVRSRLVEDFAKYGVALEDFFISRITPPEDVQKVIDQRAGMEAVGDVDRYLRFQAAQALGREGNGGGTAGEGAAAGMGLGVGAGLGLAIPGMLVERLSEKKNQIGCPDCHGDVQADSRFCAHCGHELVVSRKCPQCDHAVTSDSRFCSNCGADLSVELKCSSCQTPLPPGTRFCFHCGERVAAPPA